MVQLCPIICSCIAILLVSLVSFAAITLCVATQRVFIIVYFQSGNFWIHHRVYMYIYVYIYKTMKFLIYTDIDPASYPMDTEGSYRGSKGAGA
jgi:hypothetical protein